MFSIHVDWCWVGRGVRRVILWFVLYFILTFSLYAVVKSLLVAHTDALSFPIILSRFPIPLYACARGGSHHACPCQGCMLIIPFFPPDGSSWCCYTIGSGQWCAVGVEDGWNMTTRKVAFDIGTFGLINFQLVNIVSRFDLRGRVELGLSRHELINERVQREWKSKIYEVKKYCCAWSHGWWCFNW